MNKIAAYQQILKNTQDWDVFLLQESGLPGPRANLELIQAVAIQGDAALFERYLTYDPIQAPTNTPLVFLAVCGIVGMGRLLSEGHPDALLTLRRYANDPRWRMREGVAIGLQFLGDTDMGALLQAMQSWSRGSPFEQRAAAAALCEPRLLREAHHARQTLIILDEITASIEKLQDRKSEGFQALRKGLGYCWSVAVAAEPEAGKPLMEKWLTSPDKDIHWIMRENLKKDRLKRLDQAWIEMYRGKL
jgi:hypothetical protein